MTEGRMFGAIMVGFACLCLVVVSMAYTGGFYLMAGIVFTLASASFVVGTALLTEKSR